MGCKGCKYLLPPYLANYNSHDKNTSTDVPFFMQSCGYLASVEQLNGFRSSFFLSERGIKRIFLEPVRIITLQVACTKGSMMPRRVAVAATAAAAAAEMGPSHRIFRDIASSISHNKHKLTKILCCSSHFLYYTAVAPGGTIQASVYTPVCIIT